MTEDEKKEFEEFLQWKKEKQKKLSQEQQQPEKQVFHSEELEESQEEEPEPFYDSTQGLKRKLILLKTCPKIKIQQRTRS